MVYLQTGRFGGCVELSNCHPCTTRAPAESQKLVAYLVLPFERRSILLGMFTVPTQSSRGVAAALGLLLPPRPRNFAGLTGEAHARCGVPFGCNPAPGAVGFHLGVFLLG